jgi:hypothetical protein
MIANPTPTVNVGKRGSELKVQSSRLRMGAIGAMGMMGTMKSSS